MILSKRLLFVAFVMCAADAWGQTNRREPHIGYIYPAGGQRGTTIQITAGGQFLRGAREVYINGEGVQAKVIQYMKPLVRLKKEQRQLLQRRLKEVREKRLAELGVKGPGRPTPPKKKFGKKAADNPKASNNENNAKTEEVKLPQHPLLIDLDNKSLRELAHIKDIMFKSMSKRQPNRQLAEIVLIEITIEPGAKPGRRELRIRTGTGLTNPVVFHVGLLPEVLELEPNNQKAYPVLPNVPAAKPLDIPVTLNGQIMPGDVDRFRFRARQGQKLVIEAHARSLIPYLADAVPGWFQATLALYDNKGKEVAFADDYRFNPDPVLFYQIEKEGDYELEIRDSIYRGREDFVYRIRVAEQPFITQVFPLGGKEGTETIASVSGWNLPNNKLRLDTKTGRGNIRKTALDDGDKISNSITYAVDNSNECKESESNDTLKEAQKIILPMIINGRIDKGADVDIFRFKGHKSDKIVAEVLARRLNSPLDSLLRLTDATGKVLALNDDYVLKDSYLYKDMMGLVTHHADSYLSAELPGDGTYYIHLSDSQQHGGKAYAYRLRISEPQPDFALRVTPSSLSMRAGAAVPVCIYALRKDGFDGKIKVELKNFQSGFEIDGGWIPAGTDTVRMTVTAPRKAPEGPVNLEMEGYARIGGRVVSRAVVGADNVMQAFLYRHLVPAEELMVAVNKVKWPAPAFELAGDRPVWLWAGGSNRILIKTLKQKWLEQVQLELNQPPAGVTIKDVKVVPEGLEIQLNADKDTAQTDFAGNLIVEVFSEPIPKKQKGKSNQPKKRYSVGFLPAIPVEIVR